jgi:hypothetical protein
MKMRKKVLKIIIIIRKERKIQKKRRREIRSNAGNSKSRLEKLVRELRLIHCV